MDKQSGQEATRENKQLINFIGKFLVAATVIFVIWIFVGKYYQAALLAVADFFTRLMGYSPMQRAIMHPENAYLGNFSLVSLLALAAVTPIPLVRRGKMLLIGLPILFAVHVIDVVAYFPAYFHHSEFAVMIVTYAIGICGLLAPFAIWYVFARELPWLKLGAELKVKRH